MTNNYNTQYKLHYKVQEAIEQNNLTIVEIIDYIENKYNIRYSYEKILEELYNAK